MGRILGNTHKYKNQTRKEFGAINSSRRIPIGIGDNIDHIMVRNGGSLVVSGGTASGTVKSENPGALINYFKVNASSKGVYPGGDLKKVDPRTLLRRRQIEKGFPIIDSALTGAAGTFTIDQPYFLRFAQPQSPRPFDSALPSDAYQGIELEIAVGGRDTQFNGNDRAFDFSGVYFDVSDYREKDVSNSPKHVIVESDDVLVIAAANNRLPYQNIPVGENLLDLLIMSESGNPARTLVDTIINRVKMKYGTEIYDEFAAGIKHQQREVVQDLAQTFVGMYYIRFNKDMLLYGAIPHRKADDMSLELDVSNPGGANADQLLISRKSVLWPEDFGLATA